MRSTQRGHILHSRIKHRTNSCLSMVCCLLMIGVAFGFGVEQATGTRRRTSIELYEKRATTPSDAVASSSRTPTRSTMDMMIMKKKGTIIESKDEESKVDEYLEFLDRRYRRLHEEEVAEGKFSAWKWLGVGEQWSIEQAERQRENALYALGVAGLASKRLLHKHHIPTDADKTGASIVETPVSTQEPQHEIVVSKRTVLLSELAALAHKLSEWRQMLHRFQVRQFQKAAAMAVAVPTKAIQSLWKHGGGKRNVMLTVTVAATLMVCLARPVVQFVASEGVNMTRSV